MCLSWNELRNNFLAQTRILMLFELLIHLLLCTHWLVEQHVSILSVPLPPLNVYGFHVAISQDCLVCLTVYMNILLAVMIHFLFKKEICILNYITYYNDFNKSIDLLFLI